ncbi:MAG: MaoC family dehydratase N-terminal domain-containing protein, partial [Alphaproteobacteria bacterium]
MPRQSNSTETLEAWIGRTRETRDIVDPWPVAALLAALDREPVALHAGAEVPEFAHWLYFREAARWSELGPDGHPVRGGFLPPVELPLRMWAGGELVCRRPLRVGEPIVRSSRIEAVEAKEGSTGPLIFITVRHAISDSGGACLTERQDIVFRERGLSQARRHEPPKGEPEWRRTVTPDPVLLFRYSALTYNGHRIHYDRTYATEVEGYPGLVVHGPLVATLLMDLYRERAGRRVARFSFRAVAPLFDNAPFTLCGAPDGDGCALWALTPEG